MAGFRLSRLRRASWILILFAAVSHADDILFIGDSLSCGSFGKYAVESLSRQGNSVHLYCAVSSAPANWLREESPPGQICQTRSTAQMQLQPCGGTGKMPPFSELLAQYKGARTIVALGTNSLLSPDADPSYRMMAEAVRANGGPCEWIGPPHLNPSQSKGFPKGRIAEEENHLGSFYESLSASTEGLCSLIDSRDATQAGSPGNETVDGVHRTDSAGKYWVDRVFAQESSS